LSVSLITKHGSKLETSMAVSRRSAADLERAIRAFARGESSPQAERRLAEECRAALRAHRALMARGRGPKPSAAQIRHARLALLHLGGDAEPHSRSLRDYDHKKFGPFLGVSDEGSAAEAILTGALKSPKAIALGTHDPFELGVALDAERLGAVGEVPVGPEEYADVWVGCVEQLLMTTNVGTRVNPRLYMRPPVVTFEDGPIASAVKLAIEKVDERCRPFAKTPDGKPRPLTVYLAFLRRSNRSADERFVEGSPPYQGGVRGGLETARQQPPPRPLLGKEGVDWPTPQRGFDSHAGSLQALLSHSCAKLSLVSSASDAVRR
jgi:hypothetical protein